MRSPLSEIYNRVDGMVTYVRENLTADEYALFLDRVAPEPEPVAVSKKPTRKKPATKTAGKSRRASGMQAQLSSRRQEQATTPDDDDDLVIILCGAKLESSGLNCNLPEGHALHADRGYVDYHPFQRGAQSTALPARRRSSVNGQAAVKDDDYEVNSEAATVSAGAVAGGSNE